MALKKYTLKKLPTTGSVGDRLGEARFTIDYRERLNPAQYEAATATDGAYLIIAGAGSGKTHTLVYRVARLVESGYDPRSILLLTFTRKAAREMLTRAEALLDDRCGRVQGGTFHSFANYTLRRYAKAAGLESNFTILDQSDAEDAVNLIRSQSGMVKDKRRFPNKKTLYKCYSLSANTGREVEEIVETEYPHFLDELDAILKIHEIFLQYKRKNGLLDYDDLLIYLRDFLFELGDGAKSMLEGIKFVMIDEYQDTNRLQADIALGLTQLRRNIMVVGDDSQSIYSFRGADFKNIIEFPKLFPECEIVKLEENYRSTQYVLDFANALNETMLERYEKNLFTRMEGGEQPYVIAARNENLQSRFVVDKILELREEGESLSDIAVLFRSSFHSFDLEIELNKANLPFVKFGGMKFIETAHVKDVLAFLRVALNPVDMVSWYRILLLHEGVGPKTAQKILVLVSTGAAHLKSDISAQAAATKIPEKLHALFGLLHILHSKKSSPTEMAQLAIDYYFPLFQQAYDDHNRRKKDLGVFVNITENYDALEGLIADMAIEPPIESVSDAGPEDEEDELITLSTIHSAKGLEWRSVFVIYALDGFFPSTRAMRDPAQVEEERRLMYVASTRAKRRLFISYPMNVFDRESGTTLSKPSRFLTAVPSDFVEGYLLEE